MTNQILLVEEDETLGQVIAELLSREGYGTTHVRTTGDAERYLKKQSVEALVLDVDTVPLANDEPWSLGPTSVPRVCILMSVLAPETRGDHSILRVHRRGKRLYWVQKPFQKNALREALRQALDGNRYQTVV